MRKAFGLVAAAGLLMMSAAASAQSIHIGPGGVRIGSGHHHHHHHRGYRQRYYQGGGYAPRRLVTRDVRRHGRVVCRTQTVQSAGVTRRNRVCS